MSQTQGQIQTLLDVTALSSGKRPCSLRKGEVWARPFLPPPAAEQPQRWMGFQGRRERSRSQGPSGDAWSTLFTAGPQATVRPTQDRGCDTQDLRPGRIKPCQSGLLSLVPVLITWGLIFYMTKSSILLSFGWHQKLHMTLAHKHVLPGSLPPSAWSWGRAASFEPKPQGSVFPETLSSISSLLKGWREGFPWCVCI